MSLKFDPMDSREAKMTKFSQTRPMEPLRKSSEPLPGELLPRKGARDNTQEWIQRTTKRVSVSERHFEATAVEETRIRVKTRDG